jgi:SAM-dependent methyltransferase
LSPVTTFEPPLIYVPGLSSQDPPEERAPDGVVIDVAVHWQIKAFTQLALAYIPGGERINHLLQRANKRHTANYYRGRITGLTSMIAKYLNVEGKTIVEVGSGWDVINALILYWMGAKVVYTYDHVAHARISLIRTLIQEMNALVDEVASVTSLPPAVLRERARRLAASNDLHALFEAADIHYVAPGDAAHTGLPDHSVDILYSYAVLEHVPETVIDEVTAEAKRILKPGGIAFHEIGLQDHFVDFDASITTVNFLRYPEWWWKFLVKNDIQYINRLRAKDYIKGFERYGACVDVKEAYINPRDLKALQTMKIDRRFAGMTPEELAVTRLIVSMTFSPEPALQPSAVT